MNESLKQAQSLLTGKARRFVVISMPAIVAADPASTGGQAARYLSLRTLTTFSAEVVMYRFALVRLDDGKEVHFAARYSELRQWFMDLKSRGEISERKVGLPFPAKLHSLSQLLDGSTRRARSPHRATSPARTGNGGGGAPATNDGDEITGGNLLMRAATITVDAVRARARSRSPMRRPVAGSDPPPVTGSPVTPLPGENEDTVPFPTALTVPPTPPPGGGGFGAMMPSAPASSASAHELELRQTRRRDLAVWLARVLTVHPRLLADSPTASEFVAAKKCPSPGHRLMAASATSAENDGAGGAALRAAAWRNEVASARQAALRGDPSAGVRFFDDFRLRADSEDIASLASYAAAGSEGSGVSRNGGFVFGGAEVVIPSFKSRLDGGWEVTEERIMQATLGEGSFDVGDSRSSGGGDGGGGDSQPDGVPRAGGVAMEKRRTTSTARQAAGLAALPAFRQDMGAFVIKLDDLEREDRPFAAGAGGRVFKGTYGGSPVACKAIYSQVACSNSSCTFFRVKSCLCSLRSDLFPTTALSSPPPRHALAFYSLVRSNTARSGASLTASSGRWLPYTTRPS